MKVSVQVDTEAFNDAVRQYIKATRVEVPKAMRTQARLLFGRIIQRTFPRTRAQGRKAVARDIGRAVRVLKPQEFQSKPIQKLVRARDYEGLKAVFGRTGTKLDVVPFSPRLHQDARDSRGRVRKPQPVATPDREEVRDYMKERQDLVGRAKGGWVAAFRAAGGSPSAWVARWDRVGQAEDRLKDPVAAFIRSENASEWAEHGDDQRVVRDAMDSRTRDIVVSINMALSRTSA